MPLRQGKQENYFYLRIACALQSFFGVLQKVWAGLYEYSSYKMAAGCASVNLDEHDVGRAYQRNLYAGIPRMRSCDQKVMGLFDGYDALCTGSDDAEISGFMRIPNRVCGGER